MDLFFLALLVLLNGFLAMSEIAVVSSRKSRLQKLSDDGNLGAEMALGLSGEPSGFLSTIQVGITTIGILSGAIGEDMLIKPLTLKMAEIPLAAPYAKGISMTLVVVGLTYFSVVVGELVPKSLGLLAPESIASRVAGPMAFLSKLASPLVWLLSSSSKLILRAIGAKPPAEPSLTDDEINVLMEQGAEEGVFHESEQAIVSNVLRLDEQRIVAIMTHRNDIYTIDLEEAESEKRRCLVEAPFTRIVVCRDGLDHVVGILRTPDMLKCLEAGEKLDIERFVRPPLYIPEGVTTTHLLENFRRTRQQCALVVDEYGELQGLVTLTDVLISIVGELPSSEMTDRPEILKRPDGSWLVDGGVSIERLKSMLKIEDDFPGEEENAFNTLGGLIMFVLGRIPVEMDRVEILGWAIEVLDMDRNRVDKVLLTHMATESGTARGEGFE
ncbi:MAG: hemolysin family protein [Candidatus Accumulibacter sp.]|nr:hemolysin family protein [Accumulibacter sp.]